jgi:hypothetical protein
VPSQDCVVCRTCSTLIRGSLAHSPVEANQNHRLGRMLNSAKYLFMVLLYLLRLG